MGVRLGTRLSVRIGRTRVREAVMASGMSGICGVSLIVEQSEGPMRRQPAREDNQLRDTKGRRDERFCVLRAFHRERTVQINPNSNIQRETELHKTEYLLNMPPVIIHSAKRSTPSISCAVAAANQAIAPFTQLTHNQWRS